jgi:hypothetical protein
MSGSAPTVSMAGCRVIEFPVAGDSRGNLTVVEGMRGLLVPHLIWRELEQFSSGAICLVIASLPYDEKDYYRDYQEYVRAVATT